MWDLRGEDAQEGAECGEAWHPASGRGNWKVSCSGREGVRMLPDGRMDGDPGRCTGTAGVKQQRPVFLIKDTR